MGLVRRGEGRKPSSCWHEDGNVGDAIYVDMRSTLVSAPAGRLVSVIATEDVLVVDTNDALLMMPRERAREKR